MSISPETDPDGVDDAPSTEVHENTRHSEEGVEEQVGSDGGEPATGLIGGGASGIGEMTDPRYIAPR